jgi:hypothetical protein
LFAVFHEERVAMRSLQKSSPNSCCRDEFHTLSTKFNEPSGPAVKLDTLERFWGRSIFGIGANKSGLGIGDGVADIKPV